MTIPSNEEGVFEILRNYKQLDQKKEALLKLFKKRGCHEEYRQSVALQTQCTVAGCKTQQDLQTSVILCNREIIVVYFICKKFSLILVQRCPVDENDGKLLQFSAEIIKKICSVIFDQAAYLCNNSGKSCCEFYHHVQYVSVEGRIRKGLQTYVILWILRFQVFCVPSQEDLLALPSECLPSGLETNQKLTKTEREGTEDETFFDSEEKFLEDLERTVQWPLDVKRCDQEEPCFDAEVQVNMKVTQNALMVEQKNSQQMEKCLKTKKQIRFPDKIPTCSEYFEKKNVILITLAMMFFIRVAAASETADRNNPYGFETHSPNFREVCLKWMDINEESTVVITFCPSGLPQGGRNCKEFSTTLDMQFYCIERFKNALRPSTVYRVSVKLDENIIFEGAIKTEVEIPGVPQNFICLRLHDNDNSIKCTWDPPAEVISEVQGYLLSLKTGTSFTREREIKGLEHTYRGCNRTFTSARIRAFNLFKSAQVVKDSAEASIKEAIILSTSDSPENIPDSDYTTDSTLLNTSAKAEENSDPVEAKILVVAVVSSVVLAAVVIKVFVFLYRKRQQKERGNITTSEIRRAESGDITSTTRSNSSSASLL